jgi:DNA adenine methylase
MQYLGGKSRIAKDISAIINQYSKDKDFYSLFCGTCSVESLVVSKNKTCNDSQEYLIELWKYIQAGNILPDEITEDQYRFYKSNKDMHKAISAFVGFGCSFGGKWWGGYARQTKGLNYAKTAKNSLLKKYRGLQNANFLCQDYRNVKIENNSVIYCDPPYENTTKYSNSKEFNHQEFWEYMRTLGKDNIVFISEINAPEDFEIVWQKEFTRNLEATNVFTSVEKLFKLRQ